MPNAYARALRLPSARPSPHGLQAELLRGGSAEHERCERDLLQSGIPLPLPSRVVSHDLQEWANSSFLAIRSGGGPYLGGFAIQHRRVRLGVTHELLRVRRLGSSLDPGTAEFALQALTEGVRASPRILRLSIELFSRDADWRRRLAGILERTGYRPADEQNSYTGTLIIDLTPPEAEILQSLHSSARRNIRRIHRDPVVLMPITDPALSGRMAELMEETLRRTGGRYHPQNWKDRIELSFRNPGLSRIVGVQSTERPGPEGLLAFAWACHHGDHVQYCDAASTREPIAGRIPLSYALMWDLMVWAKANGAEWFDLGGVTGGVHADDHDPLGGISDFKRFFSTRHETVAEEWILDRHSPRARIVHRAHKWLVSRRA